MADSLPPHMIAFDWRTGRFDGLPAFTWLRLQRMHPSLDVELEVLRACTWLLHHEAHLLGGPGDALPYLHRFLSHIERTQRRMSA